jgi:hypothetical protein
MSGQNVESECGENRTHTEREKVRLGSRQGVSSSFSNSSKKKNFTTE